MHSCFFSPSPHDRISTSRAMFPRGNEQPHHSRPPPRSLWDAPYTEVDRAHWARLQRLGYTGPIPIPLLALPGRPASPGGRHRYSRSPERLSAHGEWRVETEEVRGRAPHSPERRHAPQDYCQDWWEESSVSWWTSPCQPQNRRRRRPATPPGEASWRRRNEPDPRPPEAVASVARLLPAAAAHYPPPAPPPLFPAPPATRLAVTATDGTVPGAAAAAAAAAAAPTENSQAPSSSPILSTPAARPAGDSLYATSLPPPAPAADNGAASRSPPPPGPAVAPPPPSAFASGESRETGSCGFSGGVACSAKRDPEADLRALVTLALDGARLESFRKFEVVPPEARRALDALGEKWGLPEASPRLLAALEEADRLWWSRVEPALRQDRRERARHLAASLTAAAPSDPEATWRKAVAQVSAARGQPPAPEVLERLREGLLLDFLSPRRTGHPTARLGRTSAGSAPAAAAAAVEAEQTEGPRPPHLPFFRAALSSLPPSPLPFPGAPPTAPPGTTAIGTSTNTTTTIITTSITTTTATVGLPIPTVRLLPTRPGMRDPARSAPVQRALVLAAQVPCADDFPQPDQPRLRELTERRPHSLDPSELSEVSTADLVLWNPETATRGWVGWKREHDLAPPSP